MVLYFIGVYLIKRTLHGQLEIENFSSRVEKIFHSFAALTCEICFNTPREIFVSLHGHVISSISTNHKIKTNKNAPTLILLVLYAIKQNRHPKPNQLLTKNIPCSLFIRTDTVRLMILDNIYP